MRFGGHETFAVREGWLYKGLSLLHERPDAFSDPFVADLLGVGRNMAKSIRHWLSVTGLISTSGKASSSAELTDFGRLVFERDPYMTELGTWWALHANLVMRETNALVWPWFFNMFTLERFDRTHCIQQFVRYIEAHNLRLPNLKTVTKDIQCLLTSYAQPVPAEPVDPEDSIESPFRELGLITHFCNSGPYQLRRETKDIPPQLLGYVLASTFGAEAGKRDTITVSLRRTISQTGSPGRVFVLSPEALVDAVHHAEYELGEKWISLRVFAGERVIQMRNQPPLVWLAQYYEGTHA